MNENLIAIGRSRYLYDAIIHLKSVGYNFCAIITDEAYNEYDIKHQDFENLARNVGAEFFMSKVLCNDDILQVIKKNKVRVAISANWKYTVSKKFIDLFECGILNFHLGNLPDYKGNATVNWAIINGENHIYGNIHRMEPELDAGDVIAREAININEHSYIGDILKQAERIAPLLYEKAVHVVLTKSNAFEVKGTARGLRCYPRLPEDSQIDWHQGVDEIYKLVRASSHPYQSAFTFLNGEKIMIWKAVPFSCLDPFLAVPGHVVAVDKISGNIIVACKDGMLQVQEIEKSGEKLPPATLVKSIRVRFKYNANV